MKTLGNGEFFGQTNKTLHFDGLVVTDTEYIHPYVDWHYHENAYFTFLLQGNMLEGNKKEIYDCAAGTLLYHHWQDPHYNKKPDIFTRGFHIEIPKEWFEALNINQTHLEGSFNLKNPELKILMYKIFKESKINDSNSEISVAQLLLDIFSQLTTPKLLLEKKPSWVKQIDELLHENFHEKLNLTEISQIVNVHPIHLSRDFHKYFHCNLGDYIRKLKINQSLSILTAKEKSLTEVALDCGFSDQSHFIRCFKENIGITPLKYRNLLK
ncbi:helix-turn-helix domain-containing protein [Chryseobacterium turcicum]|uniref:AraC family transcriptional regulator n=1 Tax=Chryseobacterium turcicum TaxID=2898076 RepID=A0A9Q3YYG2_9FLAO|nr:AraC family transcriptional regulator [Chryseobacterium turcicum]MCD1116430.1 AraC family transcriptional regulator [Chryseobacterium turcicum]